METFKKRICALLILCLILSAFPGGAFAAEYATFEYTGAEETSVAGEILRSRPFFDVARNDWFFTAVYFVSTHDIMRGTSNITFAPHDSFSRSMVATTLFRIHHGRLANATDPRDTPFHDVAADEWYTPYVSWAYTNGITEGRPGGLFAPDDAVTRQEFATMLHRYVALLTDMDDTAHQGPQWSIFVDRSAIAPWAYEALTWANYHGIIRGRDGNIIAPTDSTIRAEAATMLTRFMGGDADAPPPPLPESVNIAHLLDREFHTVRLDFWYIFGDIVATPPSEYWDLFSFSSGVRIGVDQNGRISNIMIDYRHPNSERFHYEGLNNRSTSGDIRATLGAPTVSDGLSYVYWLGGAVFYGPNLFFNIDSHTERVNLIQLMHMP
ncbi:MAG: S-layer homology domain-containing protein [Oscillospiraceae bacterium]|nr:S-layer homology domain-containing protein [Oscillospiraceae bacterium]